MNPEIMLLVKQLRIGIWESVDEVIAGRSDLSPADADTLRWLVEEWELQVG